MLKNKRVIFGYTAPRNTDTQWRHKSKKSENLGRCGRQTMLRPYLNIWDWDLIFGRAVKEISSPGVRSPWKLPLKCCLCHPRPLEFDLGMRALGMRWAGWGYWGMHWPAGHALGWSASCWADGLAGKNSRTEMSQKWKHPATNNALAILHNEFTCVENF